ncbi:hypothetical protein PoB_002393100 [Plakobranchus ocellatus]|uniref:Uncharacterized protein n=1 Tax=Plakobranchus ocellatus TaxID=259542 RepID=A0AAV3ZNC4_9GAST|nr:hypothetical protein PoB_002393100 [Plakobranchus ocellatus]
MKGEISILCLVLSFTGGLARSWIPGGGGTIAWSERDVSHIKPGATPDDIAVLTDKETKGTPSGLYSFVDSLLASAKNGVSADELGQKARQIQKEADSIVDSHGGKVEAANVQTAIDEAATSISGAVAISSLFDEPLIYEASKLDAALCLLNSLNSKAKAADGSDEPALAVVAAMSMTAQAIQDIVEDSVAIITHQHVEKAQEGSVQRRWKVYDNETVDECGRRGYQVGISHSWRRKRRHAVRAVNKRSVRGFHSSNTPLVYEWW